MIAHVLNLFDLACTLLALRLGCEELNRTYSDAGMMIERDGVRYSEAIDPAELGRTYTETDEPIEREVLSEAEQAEEIIAGGGISYAR